MRRDYRVRAAVRTDLDTLASFAVEEAREVEGAEKNPGLVRRGVPAGLEDPTLAAYWVAVTPDDRLAASISVVRERSNWNAGYFWWVQSLYILPAHRGRRLVELLLGAVEEAARDAGALDLRLYAHASNHRALAVYRRCGFVAAPYAIMTKPVSEG